MEATDSIIKGCTEGHKKSQEQLYKLYSRKMYAVCLMYAKDHDTAQDILQESFIKVFQNIQTFQNKGSFEGWIRRIVVNTALERYRKNHFLYPVSEVSDYTEEASYQDIMSDINAQDLLTIIQELTPQYRMVFNLYAIEGYSHQEISQMLSISEGTSKSNLSRARKILQEKVETKYYNNSSKNIQSTAW